MYLENSKCVYGPHSHKPINSKHNHNHNHEHEHDHRSVDKKVLKIGFFITLTAMFAEIIAGVISGSLALISDAIHMFTHAFALGISLFAIIIATTKRSAQKTFGYHRIEVLAAFINGFTIALSVIWIVYEAIDRLINPSQIDIKTMLIVATFGLFVNIITGVILYQGDLVLASDLALAPELLLEEVTVYKNSTGQELYSVNALYLSLEPDRIEIECRQNPRAQ